VAAKKAAYGRQKGSVGQPKGNQKIDSYPCKETFFKCNRL